MTYVRNHSKSRFIALSALPIAAVLALVGCSNAGTGAGDETKNNTVTIVVHDSFVDGDAFSKAAEAATGYKVEVLTAGDGGELTNKLVLTQGAPIADAFFGVDNTFASRMLDGEIVEPVDASLLPPHALVLAEDVDPEVADGGSARLVPIDMGATCVNVDSAWFSAQGLAEPETLEDLTDAQYRDLTVLLDPTASSTGASFMIATVAAFGEDGFADYWKALDDNGARIVQGWDDAYYGEFTGASDTGTRPIVVSYSSSPAFTVNEEGTASTTRALLDTCSTQVEYAGVLAGAANPEGAKAVIEYMLSHEFQQAIPDEMYMYPVDESVELPEVWGEFAPLPAADQTHDLTSDEVEAGLQGWLRTLGDTVGL